MDDRNTHSLPYWKHDCRSVPTRSSSGSYQLHHNEHINSFIFIRTWATKLTTQRRPKQEQKMLTTSGAKEITCEIRCKQTDTVCQFNNLFIWFYLILINWFNRMNTILPLVVWFGRARDGYLIPRIWMQIWMFLVHAKGMRREKIIQFNDYVL